MATACTTEEKCTAERTYHSGWPELPCQARSCCTPASRRNTADEYRHDLQQPVCEALCLDTAGCEALCTGHQYHEHPEHVISTCLNRCCCICNNAGRAFGSQLEQSTWPHCYITVSPPSCMRAISMRAAGVAVNLSDQHCEPSPNGCSRYQLNADNSLSC